MTDLVLVGNANSGKTTIFNYLAKDNQKTGNWLGVTTTSFSKEIHLNGDNFLLTDLAGIYCLNFKSEDEKSSIDYLQNNSNMVILNILDCFNLRRSLLLTLSLKQAGLPVVCVLNFHKKFIKKKCLLDIEKLIKNLGLDVIIFEKTEKFKEELKNCVEKVANKEVKSRCAKIYSVEDIKCTYRQVDITLEGCYENNQKGSYGFDKIDKLLLNKWLAFPIFCLIMLLVFFISFGFVGQSLGFVFEKLSSFVINLVGKGLLIFKPHAAIMDVYFNVVGVSIISVFKFCSQVMMVLLCLNVLAQSGYITRIAFVFDDFLEKIGLSGKGVFTLLLGLGCATSAISTSRVIENYEARRKTAMLTSLMPCMAKLPLTLAIVSTFFSRYIILVMFVVYVVSLLLIAVLAVVLNRGVMKTQRVNSILEFPSFKLVNCKQLAVEVYTGVRDFSGRVLMFSVLVSLAIYLLSNLKVGGFSVFNGIAEFVGFFSMPLGLNIGIISSALILGFLAKELIASSVLPFLSSLLVSGVVSLPVAVSLLIFTLFYTPCYSTFYAIKAEFDKATANLTILTQFCLAYVLSFITYNAILITTNQFVFDTYNLIITTAVVGTCVILIRANVRGLKFKPDTASTKIKKCTKCAKCSI